MRTLYLGTRNSQLALIQAKKIKEKLRLSGVKNPIEIVEIDTKGDRKRHISLPELGGGGVFLKEIEAALLAKEIDFAVHSLKDMPAVLPANLHISAIPDKADNRDAFLSHDHIAFDALPSGAVVGTSSHRRAAQLKRMRSDIKTAWIRGPIDDRIKQMKAGNYDAIVLAVAGLKRLNLALDEITAYLPLNEFVPAPGQGALAVESRQDDAELNEILQKINDPISEKIVLAERFFLAHFDAGEAGPIGGYGKIIGDEVEFYGMVISADGQTLLSHTARHENPEVAANEVANQLKTQGAFELIRAALKQ